jgi:hypothetical protein
MKPFDRTVRSGAVPLLIAGFLCILHADAAPVDGAPTSPARDGASAAPDAAPPQARPRQQRAVFVCQDGGIPVFADRPCGAAAEARTLSVEASRAGAPATTTPRAPRATTRPLRNPRVSTEAPQPAADERCAVLQRQLDEINSRMRSGYSAREAARLWQRWREARDRVRAAHC